MTLKELLQRDEDIFVYVYLGKFRLGAIGTSMAPFGERFLFSSLNVPVTLQNMPSEDSERLGFYHKYEYENVDAAKQTFFDSAPGVDPALFRFVDAVTKTIIE